MSGTLVGLTPGRAQGELLKLDKPLSLWGGMCLKTGVVTDVTHPQHGMSLAGRVIAMRYARGSSSSSSALVEAARAGCSPAAILLCQADPILVVGALVAAELYDVEIPIIRVSEADLEALPPGTAVLVTVGATFARIVPTERGPDR